MGNPFLGPKAGVYELLLEDINDNINLMAAGGQTATLIRFLDQRGILDYDTLREIYLNEIN